MQLKLLVLAATVSSGAFTTDGQLYWAIYGPLDKIENIPNVVDKSTGPVILRSDTTPDCYELKVTPNGSLYTKWTECPK